MIRALAAGTAIGVTLAAVVAVAFAYGVGPGEWLLEHDPTHPF